jgi:excisionase family DNA binding protein
VKEGKPEPPLLISRKEAARSLGVCESHLQRLAKQGVFKVVRLGRAVRYRRDAVEAALRAMEGD